MNVPFLDLNGLHDRVKPELDEAIATVIGTSSFIGGAPVKAFEAELARYMDRDLAKGVSSCTAALAISIRALGIEPGDEVITTVHTAIPTAEAIELAGARVVFADIDKDTYQIDPDQVSARITDRTKAILPVHLYGLAAPIDRILALAEPRGIAVIEDIAQAQGARFFGKRLGTFGKAGCLSFFPSKNLGGFGDGGAVVTNDPELHRFVAMYSDHGRLEKFTHELSGANERLDGLQAAILRVKLAHLDTWNAQRREVAGWYEEELGGQERIRLPRPIEGCEPVWHLYVARVDDRDGLQASLREHDIGTGLHYPMPLHEQPAFAKLGHKIGSFPAAETVCSEILSLPMDPFLTRDQIGFACEKIRAFLRG